MTTGLTIVCPPKLGRGKHKPEDEMRCAWEAVNIALTGELTDKCPPCTHRVLHSRIMAANDTVSDAARHRVWPYALRALGTRSRPNSDIATAATLYAFKCADEAIRVHAVNAMDNAGLTEQATKLRSIPVVCDARAAEAARAAAWSAWSAAGAARSAEAARAAGAVRAARAARAAGAASARAAADEYHIGLLEALLPE